MQIAESLRDDSGNIATLAGVEKVIGAFHKARLPQAQMVTAGDGSARAACVALVNGPVDLSKSVAGNI
jgi:hypothetical protein